VIFKDQKNIMKEFKQCPLCQSSSLRTQRTYQFEPDEVTSAPTLSANASYEQERLWIYFHRLRKAVEPVSVAITACNDCGFLFSNPRLSEAELVLKYQTIAELGNDQAAHAKKQPPYLQQRQTRVHNWLKAVWPQTTERALSVLDYGGAEGYLLVPFLEDGHSAYLCDYIAYKPADERIKYLGQDISSIPAAQNFDLIFCLHTLEHVADPIGIVSRLGEQLSDDGALYVEVPLGAWLEWNDVREPITHVNYFSEQSLKYVMEAAGLEVVALQSNWQYVTNAKHLCINILGRKKRGAPTATQPTVQALSTPQQMKSWRYLPGALQANPKYYLKQWLKAFIG
jgi:predicted Zn-ribbon and HTH transcriptional regulator